MSFTRSNSSQAARKRLAGFVQKRLHELQMSDGDFMRAMDITNRQSLTRRLSGKAMFRMDECQRLAAVLSCNERELIFLHLAQFHSEDVINRLTRLLQDDRGAADEMPRPPRVMIYERLTVELAAE